MSLELISLLVTVGVSLFGLIGWFLKQTVYDPIQETKKEIKEHKVECNQIPKSLILEKVDNLCERVDTHQEYVKEMRSEIKEDIKGINDTLSFIRTSQMTASAIKLQDRYFGQVNQ